MKLMTPLYKKPYIELENEQEKELFKLDKDKEIERQKEIIRQLDIKNLELTTIIKEVREYMERYMFSQKENYDYIHLLGILKGVDEE